MHREIEAKILNVDPEAVQRKLKELGAVLECELDLEQVVWWIEGANKDSVRVRKASDGSIRFTMKRKVTEGLGYEEWETGVDDYETTVAIIDNILSTPQLRLEYPHHRQDWQLDGALININWFPCLAPSLEIEGESEEQVRAIAQKLGFDLRHLVNRGIVSLLFDALQLKLGDKVKLNNAGLV